MRKRLPCLILTALLLCGCAAPAALPVEPSAPGLYRPGALEAASDGALLEYPLEQIPCSRIFLADDRVLLDGQTGEERRITLLAGPELPVAGTLTVPKNSRLHPRDDGLDVFDPDGKMITAYDEALQPVGSFPLPQEAVSALRSADGALLFYATQNTVRCIETDSGIDRLMRQIPGGEMALRTCSRDSSILQLEIQTEGTTRTLFLAAGTGAVLRNLEGRMDMTFQPQRFAACLYQNGCCRYLYGSLNGSLGELTLPRRSRFLCYCENRAISCRRDPLAGTVTLDRFDLTTGQHDASLTIPADEMPVSAAGSADGSVFLLMGRSLLRWVPDASACHDDACYTDAVYTADHPDIPGLADCSALAGEIGSRHGVTILLGSDAVALQPWDYDLTEEYLVPRIRDELYQLDETLSLFPPEILDNLAGPGIRTTICLVRSIVPAADTAPAYGLQFRTDGEARIALTVGGNTAYNLCHEIGHMIDTQVLIHYPTFDSWDSLNPPGFRYPNRYGFDASRYDADLYSGDDRAFIDRYSMSFATEDRARILEYAINPGNEDLFRSPVLQAKLLKLCIGLRKAFALTKSPEDYPWEQYLDQPLAFRQSQ